MKILLKFLTCFAFIAGACSANASEVNTTEITAKNCSCDAQARERAKEIDAAMSATFPLLVPATAVQGSEAFASYFADEGVFQSPGGILNGQTAIFEGFLAYAQDPGERNQHVINREVYWDNEKATLTVERTWYATLTVDTVFGQTLLFAGTTYSQDDCIVIRFACDHHCHHECVLPGKVVYYREYFDPSQFESNYTDAYPSVCHRLGEKS
jgi:hypothetical protein